MKISVITVCYNSARTLQETIQSVVAQSHVDVEYIIVDGGSTDQTQEIIRRYLEHIDHYVSEPDSGIYDAMNKGISLATGDVVCILNSDDLYSNDRVLETVVKTFEKNPSVEIVFGDLIFKDQLLSKLLRVCRFKFFKPALLRFGWMPPHPATFVRKSVYEDYGFYSLSFKIAADYEMFVRWLLVHRLNWLHISEVLVDMRIGGASTAGVSSSIVLNFEIVKACKENNVYTNIFFVLVKLPFKLLELRI